MGVSSCTGPICEGGVLGCKAVMLGGELELWGAHKELQYFLADRKSVYPQRHPHWKNINTQL